MFNNYELLEQSLISMNFGDQLNVKAISGNYIGSRIYSYVELKNMIFHHDLYKATDIAVQEARDTLDYYSIGSEEKNNCEIVFEIIHPKEFEYGRDKECR